MSVQEFSPAKLHPTEALMDADANPSSEAGDWVPPSQHTPALAWSYSDNDEVCIPTQSLSSGCQNSCVQHVQSPTPIKRPVPPVYMRYPMRTTQQPPSQDEVDQAIAPPYQQQQQHIQHDMWVDVDNHQQQQQQQHHHHHQHQQRLNAQEPMSWTPGPEGREQGRRDYQQQYNNVNVEMEHCYLDNDVMQEQHGAHPATARALQFVSAENGANASPQGGGVESAIDRLHVSAPNQQEPQSQLPLPPRPNAEHAAYDTNFGNNDATRVGISHEEWQRNQANRAAALERRRAKLEAEIGMMAPTVLAFGEAHCRPWRARLEADVRCYLEAVLACQMASVSWPSAASNSRTSVEKAGDQVQHGAGIGGNKAPGGEPWTPDQQERNEQNRLKALERRRQRMNAKVAGFIDNALQKAYNQVDMRIRG